MVEEQQTGRKELERKERISEMREGKEAMMRGAGGVGGAGGAGGCAAVCVNNLLWPLFSFCPSELLSSARQRTSNGT